MLLLLTTVNKQERQESKTPAPSTKKQLPSNFTQQPPSLRKLEGCMSSHKTIRCPVNSSGPKQRIIWAHETVGHTQQMTRSFHMHCSPCSTHGATQKGNEHQINPKHQCRGNEHQINPKHQCGHTMPTCKTTQERNKSECALCD